MRKIGCDLKRNEINNNIKFNLICYFRRNHLIERQGWLFNALFKKSDPKTWSLGYIGVYPPGILGAALLYFTRRISLHSLMKFTVSRSAGANDSVVIRLLMASHLKLRTNCFFRKVKCKCVNALPGKQPRACGARSIQ